MILRSSKDSKKIENIDSTTNKEEEDIFTSQEKLESIIKLCKIPSFEDEGYTFLRPLGEGNYGTIYLVENNETKKQYIAKKIVCEILPDLIKYKNDLEFVYSLQHENIIKIFNVQYKCLDFTTYCIQILMERTRNDWGEEIRRRKLARENYKEEELIKILKQLVSV